LINARLIQVDLKTSSEVELMEIGCSSGRQDESRLKTSSEVELMEIGRTQLVASNTSAAAPQNFFGS
jgi:hypothetical protein